MHCICGTHSVFVNTSLHSSNISVLSHLRETSVSGAVIGNGCAPGASNEQVRQPQPVLLDTGRQSSHNFFTQLTFQCQTCSGVSKSGTVLGSNCLAVVNKYTQCIQSQGVSKTISVGKCDASNSKQVCLQCSGGAHY